MATENNIKDLFAHAMSEFLKENYGKSKELLNSMLEMDPNHKLALVTRGTAHLKLNHADSALEDFNRAIEIDPAYARALHMRGAVRERLGDDEGALSDFGKAVEIHPEYAAAYYSRATLLSKLGREDRATEDIETVMHLTNRNIEAFANDNNVWRSQHMRLESMLESDMVR